MSKNKICLKTKLKWRSMTGCSMVLRWWWQGWKGGVSTMFYGGERGWVLVVLLFWVSERENMSLVSERENNIIPLVVTWLGRCWGRVKSHWDMCLFSIGQKSKSLLKPLCATCPLREVRKFRFSLLFLIQLTDFLLVERGKHG